MHQVGSNSEFKDLEKAKNIKADNYKYHDFLGGVDQAQALADAEVVVSRSGAHIVYELGLWVKMCFCTHSLVFTTMNNLKMLKF